MAFVVIPLAAVLLWLGWRAVDTLEQRSVEQRMAALDDAVSGFLTGGLRTIVSVGLALGEAPSFSPQAGLALEDERSRQLVALLKRHPAVAAVYLGDADGRFLFAGHMTSFSAEQRDNYGASSEEDVIVRTISGDGAARQESWWFRSPGGERSPEWTQRSDYDPRTRPWYEQAIRSRAPALTEPYLFAQSRASGISAGVPMQGGRVIGFDFTLDTLSRLLGDYKVTPNSIIMVVPESSTVF